MISRCFSGISYPIMLAVVSAVIGLFAAGIIYANEGHFTYTLDDPYIHLQMAKNIAQGHYGLNLGEFASPSSSILWPLLLAPFTGFSWGYLAPLLINSVACLFTAAIIFRSLIPRYPHYAACVTWLLLLLSNSLGLVFNGMEHSVQLLCAVCIVTNMIALVEKHRVSRWLFPALFVAPLIRYEMFALVLGAAALLIMHRRFVYVLPVIAGTCVVMAFSFFLWQHNQYLLPASVLAKIERPHDWFNAVCLLAVCLFALSLLWQSCNKKGAMIISYIVAAALAHLLLARAGWFGRYEAYILLSLMVVCAYYLPTSKIIPYLKKPALRAVMACGIVLVTLPYTYITASTIVASNGIYAPQAQMSRFVRTSGTQRVAAGDIGYVSYASSVYVYDIWGLGDIRQHRMLQEDTPALLANISQHNIPLVMIYRHWLSAANIPKYWVRLGTLTLEPAKIFTHSVAGRAVDFYATSEQAKKNLIPTITAWKTALPSNAQWKVE